MLTSVDESTTILSGWILHGSLLYAVLGSSSSGSSISWIICKSFAPHSTQITMPAPHHSIFTGRIFFLTPSQQC